MKISDVMTDNPVCCTPDTKLQDVARIMQDKNCGVIPIVENAETRKPVGILTDRDITCRSVALGKNPLDLTAGDLMTQPVQILRLDTNIDEGIRLMEKNQIRRIPVVDENGACCGILAQADIARKMPETKIAEFIKDISREAARAV